ncbi:MAG TPA: glycosyltransferase [Lacunisphaera sp.]|nr:glycosyltransferase [Lacunisphaera sp.]
MRLLYLTRTYTGHDARWLRVLAEQGLALGFLPLQHTHAGGFTAAHPNVELLSSPGLPAGANTRELDDAEPLVRQVCRHWRPDVVLAGPLTDAGYLAARILPERTLMMSWAFDVLHEPAVSPAAAERLKVALGAGRYLFADCQDVARQCEALAGREYHGTCVLPWGLAAEDKPVPTTVRLRRRFGDESSKVVIYTRGFEPVHQPQIVIEAFRQAFSGDSRLRLLLAGAGSLRARLENTVETAGLKHAVRFLGQLDQAGLAGALAEADVYLACSLSDGSSISLLQAMHAGLPCIAAELPGNREWLEPGGGWLVSAGEPDGFGRAIQECLHLSSDARELMAGTNRSRASLRANLEDNLPRLLRLCEVIALESRPGRASLPTIVL